MIAVISDLHFEEEASDIISGDGKQIIFQHCEAYGKPGPVFVMDADGSNQKEILKSEGYIEGGRAAWNRGASVGSLRH